MEGYSPNMRRMTDIDSPCIRTCTLDEDDVCIGCGRSLDEITIWSVVSQARKREILALSAERLNRRRERRRS